MADNAEYLPIAPAVPSVPHLYPINQETASEMAHRKHEVAKATKGQRNARAIARQKIISQAADEAIIAGESKSMEHLTTEDIADKVVRRHLKIALFGGDLFAPTDLKQAMDCANQASQIAMREATRLRNAGKVSEDDETENQKAAVAMVKQMRRKLRDIQTA